MEQDLHLIMHLLSTQLLVIIALFKKNGKLTSSTRQKTVCHYLAIIE